MVIREMVPAHDQPGKVKKHFLKYLLVGAAILLASCYVAARFPGGDFSVYYSAGNSFLEGRLDLYSPDFGGGQTMEFLYPPVFLFLAVPFSILTFFLAKFFFAVITLFLVSLAVSMLWKAFLTVEGSFAKSKLVLFGGVLLTLKYFLMSMRVMNVHLIVLSLLVICFVLLLRKRTAAAAGVAALAISMKFFPIVSLPYFAVKRLWTFVILTVVILAGLLILPSIYFGPRINYDLHREWIETILFPSPTMELNRPLNQSVFGPLERLLTDVRYEDRIGDTDYPKINVLEFDRHSVKAVGYLLASLIFLTTLLVIYLGSRPVNAGSNRWFETSVFHEFGLVLAMMLLVGPVTNRIYPAALFVPSIALLASVIRDRSKIALAALVPLTIAAIVVPLIPGAKVSRYAHALSFDFFAALGAWVGLLIILIRTPSVNISHEDALTSPKVT
jgi:hypothetical protein